MSINKENFIKRMKEIEESEKMDYLLLSDGANANVDAENADEENNLFDDVSDVDPELDSLIQAFMVKQTAV